MTITPPIQLTDTLKSLYIKTAQKLKGSDRRQFMAEVVKGLGIGGQTLAEREFDTVETVLHFAETLTFKGQRPVVTLVETVYKIGVKLIQQAMA